MTKMLAVMAVLALSACAASGGGASGRTDWSCANGRAFSLRYNAAGAAEVFAGGQTYTLAPSGSNYSNGQVIYSPQGGGASLTGAFGGPYENCRRG